MKRLIFICAAVTGLLWGMPVLAEDSADPAAAAVRVYPNAYALYTVGWGGGYPYPEGITGVWSETGGTDRLVFGISADADTEQIKADILAQIEDKDSVSFLVQAHSYELLHEIYGGLSAEREQYGAADVYTWAIHENENCVAVGADIENPSPELEAFMAECKEKYGDAVQFYECEGVSPTAAVVTHANPAEENSTGPDIGGEPDMQIGAVTIEETDDEIPAAAEEQMLDAGGIPESFDAVPEFGTIGLETVEKTHHRAAIWIAAAGILLSAGLVGLLLHRRAAQRLLQNNAGGTQTANAAHPDIPAMMRQTAELPPDDLRQKILDAARSDE